MRLYRGLSEPYKPEKVTERSGAALGNGANFTDCPYAALAYAKSGRGVLVVLDVPPEQENRVSEQLWLRDDAKRLMIWGRFDAFLTAALPAKELRAELKKLGMSKFSVKDSQRSWVLGQIVERRLDEARRAGGPVARSSVGAASRRAMSEHAGTL